MDLGGTYVKATAVKSVIQAEGCEVVWNRQLLLKRGVKTNSGLEL